MVGEFGRIALEFLKRGTTSKIYEGAASKMHLSVLSNQKRSAGSSGICFLIKPRKNFQNTYLSAQNPNAGVGNTGGTWSPAGTM